MIWLTKKVCEHCLSNAVEEKQIAITMWVEPKKKVIVYWLW